MNGVFENIDNFDADWDRKDREEREALARKHRSLGLDPDWYENVDQMSEDIAGRPASAQKAIQGRVNAQQSARRGGFATGVAPMLNHGASGAYLAAAAGAEQARHAQGMLNMTMDAWQDENDSRVSQVREMRRMEHEKEMERIRQETERMKIEALLARLNQESRGGRTTRFPGGSITSV